MPLVLTQTAIKEVPKNRVAHYAVHFFACCLLSSSPGARLHERESNMPKQTATKPTDKAHDMRERGDGHQKMDHFPSPEELFRTPEELLATRHGWGRPPMALDPEEAGLRFDRHVRALQVTASPAGLVADPRAHLDGAPRSWVWVRIRPWIIALLASLLRSRVDHRTLDAAQRDAFNQALQDAYADGSYQDLANIHAQNHMQHTMMGPDGTWRFLPWHRLYLLKLEDLLRQKQSGLTVPYWDYANDHNRPDWVWQPPGVVRNTPGANGGALPTQATIDGLLTTSTYYDFTYGLEFNAHNQVHNWCNGTISSPMTATQDPIFWLLHAEVDGIWDKWQLNHTGMATLSGNMAELDPWQPPGTFVDVNDTVFLGYSYG
jgi:tyrosinase